MRGLFLFLVLFSFFCFAEDPCPLHVDLSSAESTAKRYVESAESLPAGDAESCFIRAYDIYLQLAPTDYNFYYESAAALNAAAVLVASTGTSSGDYYKTKAFSAVLKYADYVSKTSSLAFWRKSAVRKKVQLLDTLYFGGYGSAADRAAYADIRFRVKEFLGD